MTGWIAAVLLMFASGCGDAEDETFRVHVVVRGDTLSRIARDNGVQVAELMEWNDLSSDRIEVGQELKLMHASGGTVAVVVDSKRPRKRKSVSVRNGKPEAKPCLKGPSLDDLDNDDVEIRGSQGLERVQLQSVMSPFLPTLGGCFDGDWPTAEVSVEITVGCNGLVSASRVIDSGGLDSETLGCMLGRVQTLGFPAHDMPDGFTFQHQIVIGP
jgi:LysM repeat protein